MNILFLSDIHFGREKLASGSFEQRDAIMSKILETIAGLPNNMKPHYIVTTGDIAWSGAYREYQDAYAWYSRLLEVTGLTGKHLSFCTGNHDIDRRTAVGVSENEIITENGMNLKKVDYLYNYNLVEKYETQIREFNKFCDRLGVIPYEYPVARTKKSALHIYTKKYSYTIGCKDLVYGKKKYQIVGFNTAMLSGYPNMPDDEMFIGLPQVKSLIEGGQLKRVTESDVYTIALFHHAERFLDTNEMNSYGKREATLPLLLNYVNLALCGHTETGAIPTRKMQEDGGLMINGGATYYSDDHPNTFSVLHIDEDTNCFDSCTFIWRNGTWTSFRNVDTIDWKSDDIQFDPPGFLFDRDHPWKIIFSAGGKEKCIPVPFMEGQMYPKNGRLITNFNNKRDVTRIFDINISPEEGFSLKPAEPYRKSVQARIEQLEFNIFLDTATNKGNLPHSIAVVQPDGKTVMTFGSADKIPVVDEREKQRYQFLQRLKKIEDYFSVRFFIDDDTALEIEDQILMGILESVIKGDIGQWYMDSDVGIVYFCSRKEVFDDIVKENNGGRKRPICLTYAVPLICHLLGADIDLGICELNIVNLIPHDMHVLQRQRDTFMKEDRRRIVLEGTAKTITNIINSQSFDCEAIKRYEDMLETTYLRIRIESQAFIFGNVIEPNRFFSEKKRIKLAETMRRMPDNWKNLKFM